MRSVQRVMENYLITLWYGYGWSYKRILRALDYPVSEITAKRLIKASGVPMRGKGHKGS